MNLQISCTLCSKPFLGSNPPRIAKKCPHTYCENCIKTAQTCPMDKIPFEFSKHGIQGFHINRTIVKMLKLNLPTATTEVSKSPAPLTPKLQTKKTSQKKITPLKSDTVKAQSIQTQIVKPIIQNDQSSKCLLHNKELDLVCIDHAVKICSNCALFGEHKNHRVKPIETLIGQCACLAQQTLGILTDVKQHQKLINNQRVQKQIIESFKDKRATFTKVIDKIKKQQKSLVNQLDKVIQTSKEEILYNIKFEQCMKKKQIWINQAKDLLKIIDSFPSYSKVQQASKYLNQQYLQSSLVERGGYILVQMQMTDKIFKQKLLSTISDISSQISPLIDSQIESWYKIFKVSQKQQNNQISLLSPSKTKDKLDQDQLLQPFDQFTNQFENQYNSVYEYNTYVNTESSNSYILTDYNRPMQYLNSYQQPSHMDSFSRSHSSGKSLSKPPIPQSKKVKKLKVPPKYESVLQDLMSDRTDCIDFTNAQLGDNIVIGLCQYIRVSSKLKTLKLIRCKISDDSIQSILNACKESRITSLNLGQNLLTDQTLQLISRLDIGDVKSITLSQNKINQRSSKDKILQMKNRGIILSI